MQLTKSATNVADFVEQMKNLKRIDKRIPKVKDKVGFIGQICNIIESYKGQITAAFDKDIPKKMKNFHTLLLQNLSSECIFMPAPN